jgi:hypothetical protein
LDAGDVLVIVRIRIPIVSNILVFGCYNRDGIWFRHITATTAMLRYTQSELESVKADALSSDGKSPVERMAMFADLLATVSAVWASFPAEERRRRMWIADQLHRRPDPWWKNFRQEALAEYQWRNSSR